MKNINRYRSMISAAILVLIVVVALAFIPKAQPLDCKEASPLAREVVESFAEEPEAWSGDRSYVEHESGLSFWIASGPRFVRPVQDHMHDDWEADETSVSQQCVWNAYREWRLARQYEPCLNDLCEGQ